jgi:hypothetical protein
MNSFDVQGIELQLPREDAFAFIADPARLPEWTQAFVRAGDGRAVMRTPQGEIDVGLEVRASAHEGTIDWRMSFPDGTTATAFSRVVELARDRCAYSFVLTAPPVALERLEGALEAQSRTLAQELAALKQRLER